MFSSILTNKKVILFFVLFFNIILSSLNKDKDIASCFNITSKGSLEKHQIDPNGFSQNPGDNLAVVGEHGRLYICRGQTVTEYFKDGKYKDRTIYLDSKPQRIFWFRQYLVALIPPKLENEKSKGSYTIKIYELKSNCIFGVNTIQWKPEFFLNEWNCLTLISENGKLALFDEPNTETKIMQLCNQHNRFDVALKIAKKQKKAGIKKKNQNKIKKKKLKKNKTKN